MERFLAYIYSSFPTAGKGEEYIGSGFNQSPSASINCTTATVNDVASTVTIGTNASNNTNISNVPQGYYEDSIGNWHRSNGQFASNTEVGLIDPGKHYLHRPYIRQATIDAVNAKTKIDYTTGQIYDSIGNKYVDPANVELGHTPGNEFWRWRDWAESKGMTQSDFNDFMNNPDFYAWQDIHDNRSHLFEQKN